MPCLSRRSPNPLGYPRARDALLGALARLAAIGLVLLAVFVAAPARAQGVPIAAAGDLKFALAEAGAAYQRETGRELRIAYGSSGNFTQQIENGAPFELFLSADETYVERLRSKGLTRDAGALYAVGRLALFVPAGSVIGPDAALDELKTALAAGRLRRFAIANPEHAPYGRAAREVLQRTGIWEAIRPRLVLGESAAQAAQFASSSDVDGGIIPYSLAIAPQVAKLGSATLLPSDMHAPLRQRMVLMPRASPPAVAFYEWLQGPLARSILERYGFTLPDRSCCSSSRSRRLRSPSG